MTSFLLTASAVLSMASSNAKLPDAAEAALKKADSVEVFSLEPVPGNVKGPDAFHGYKVLGKTTLKGDDARKAAAAVLQGVADSDGTEADCFEPRHGLRLVYDGKTIDLVVCFHCRSIQAFADGKELGATPTAGSAEAVVDKLLKDAGVSLAPKADK